jgi:Cu(I)/Ag(I) efflux system membrane protein CusA/SilA
MIKSIIEFFTGHKPVTIILLVLLAAWGVVTAPFEWEVDWLPRDRVAVDAIPDIGENQQIVFTEWPGRSPQDIQDQITYPLSSSLLGIPGVKTIRSNTIFGFSSIYIIFEDGIDFYWSRSRILEKLNSLPSGLLPEGVQPQLGPDATALGQIFWYTLEGRNKEGQIVGGWDLQELRSIQDFQVKYALSSVEGVAEVASIGGYVREYQIDLKPQTMLIYGITIQDVVKAVQGSNLDVGAQTMEINSVEYMVRGLGYLESLEDLEKAVVKVVDNTPVLLEQVAFVSYGPAPRRGILDKSGAEVVGGVVVARHGANPMAVIERVNEKIAEIEPGLPSRLLADSTLSKVSIVPFYDRSELIRETIHTLEEALSLEILITILVIIILVLNLRASLLIAGILPLSVLMVFIAMRYLGIDANIVALTGIAIAIGTMVDLGIILLENIIQHLRDNKEEKLSVLVLLATHEVSSAIITAVATTIISFLPVFALQDAEGKLFRPLAYTKTFALVSALLVTLLFLPTLAQIVYARRWDKAFWKRSIQILLLAGGIALCFVNQLWSGIGIIGLALWFLLLKDQFKEKDWTNYVEVILLSLICLGLLARYWEPLGPEPGVLFNGFFVAILTLGTLLLFYLFLILYERILKAFLENKILFLSIPTILILFSLLVWRGWSGIFSIEPGQEVSPFTQAMQEQFPGVGQEFMPALDEGAFLLMPTTMPHAGVEENKRILQYLDMAVNSIPEVDMVVGKAGRVESALDPAPLSMFENIITYKPEYLSDGQGNRVYIETNEDGLFKLATGGWISAEEAVLLDLEESDFEADPNGKPLRQWRDHIQSPDDIWEEISAKATFPGLTGAPKLQPIQTRLVMLQTGLRADLGIKITGKGLSEIESFGMELEEVIKTVDGIKSSSVFADRIVGKPYLEMDINRDEIARYGLHVTDIQHQIEIAIGGMPVTYTVEGIERYPVRIRHPREWRSNPEELKGILLSTPSGLQVPLGDLVDIQFTRGPQVIKGDNTFLAGYVIFENEDGVSEVEAVNRVQSKIESVIESGELIVPAGVSFSFTGNYQNQLRANKRLSILVPIALILIFLILYLQFRSISTALMVFGGVAVAFSGGFLMIWLYGQEWFLNFSLFDTNLRELFNMQTVNLSVAVWVGFIALFGIATDDGVVMATYLRQSFRRNDSDDIDSIHHAIIEAGKRRVRPCLMTTATTLLALLPVLSSQGRGSNIMIPMAIPVFGGMTIALITLFVIPVLYSAVEEGKLKFKKS